MLAMPQQLRFMLLQPEISDQANQGIVMHTLSSIKLRAAGLLVVASLALSSCFISPGKFDSNLQLENDGTYSFNYDGEIFFLGLSDLAKMGKGPGEFAAEDCFDEETYDPRECTDDELAQQRAEWDERATQRAEKAERDAKEMAAVMGGIDPTDPESTEDLRKLLLRQKGWNKVEALGNGLFDVEFAIAGQLSHDLMFPVIEGFPTTNMFVQVILRDDNVVRVNAPGFAAQGDSNPMGAMMGGMSELAGLAALGKGGPDGENTPQTPSLEGTFTITTNGDILANNTDEGPVVEGTASVLSWAIDNGTKAAPTALVKLDQ